MNIRNQNLISDILQSDCAELTGIVKAVITRYETLFPDTEIIFLSLPRDDPDERRKILFHAAGFLDQK